MRKHILLVDDDDDIREVVRISLEAVGGWQVSSASSGIEGIAKAIAERPDAILLDVMMPGIDGPATFKRLQHDPATRNIPVILLTAKARAPTFSASRRSASRACSPSRSTRWPCPTR